MIVLGATANQVHRSAVCAAKFDFLAAVVQAGAIFLGYKLIELGHEQLAVFGFSTGDIDK
jgi:hypothetical protein